MAHKYYCTNCARELDQEHVLIDLQYALTVSVGEGADKDKKEDNQEFQILKFRTTVQEFENLVARGNVGDLGYIRIDISIGELAAFMANERNLDDQKIASLSLEDINSYLAALEKKQFGGTDKTANEAVSFANGIGNFNTDAIFGGTSVTVAPVTAAAPEEIDAVPEAIQALKDQIFTYKNTNLNERMLEEELSQLQKLVGDNGCIPVELKCIRETADDGSEILVGYDTRRDGRHVVMEDARRCCHCSAKVFKHAGEAPHQAVAFIGDQGSGKTSTILALTHYAEYAAQGVLPDDPIWVGSSGIEGIEYMQPVGVDDDLKKDLEWYGMGVAPEKTKAQQREDAYSSTFWIVNVRGEKFILTLIDLPGELCKDDGTIDKKRIKDEFPVAMASDSFIMCFDTEEAKGQKAAEIISKTRSWANEFQTLRREYKKESVIRKPGDTTPELTADCIAPMMLVFTKCDELEDQKAEGELENKRQSELECRGKYEADRVKEIYSLKVERDYIDLNPVYKRVGKDVRTFENLKNAYIARLRTSPYGFAAPKKSVYLEIEEKRNNGELPPDTRLPNENEDGKIRYPKPKHVAELMRWLLTVTSCVSAPAVYIPNPQEPDRCYRPDNLFVRGAQYRTWAPQGKIKQEKMNAAMCRAYLFENYSEQDSEIINNFFDPVPIPPIPGLIEKIWQLLKRGKETT